MSGEPGVVIFGEVLFDEFPDGERRLGGAPFNVAWHLRGFGLDPLLLSAVGQDAQGDTILERMAEGGLRTGGVARLEDRPTGRVVVRIVDGEPGYEIPPDQAWDRIPSALPELGADGPPTLLYHGTLALRDEHNRHLLRRLLANGAMRAYLDVNLRAPWWTHEGVAGSLADAAWVRMNEGELLLLESGGDAGSVPPAERARRLVRRHRLERLVVTRGAAGALEIVEGDRQVESPGIRREGTVDTVGAGDAFSAVHMLGLIRGWAPEVALRRANLFAADVCRIPGATPPDDTLYREHQTRWGEEDRAGGEGGPEGGNARPAAPGTPTDLRDRGLHILSLSLHGLLRGEALELGRDADTGGQIAYVVDQARALARHPAVDRVEVVTRLLLDRQLDDSYAEPREPLGEGAEIVRIPFGPRRYLRKESLWPHLETLLERLEEHVEGLERQPDFIVGHYADAGWVGCRLATRLGVPFVFIGHSLGRPKRASLLEDGADPEELEERYRISRRIAAEEDALACASLLVSSTRQELARQYAGYDTPLPRRSRVIPPGVDLHRFSPPEEVDDTAAVTGMLQPFLRQPDRPMVLAVARADEKKNLPALVEAFGRHADLRDRANLVVVAGVREDLADLTPAARRVVYRILAEIDRWNLYGHVAFPKHHDPEDIPALYRAAARSRGVFVNPALVEPFGLTLLEAAASGLPVVATRDGGPPDILAACSNGLLVDPLDPEDIGRAIHEVISAPSPRWDAWSREGLEGVYRTFTWARHAEALIEALKGEPIQDLPPDPKGRSG